MGIRVNFSDKAYEGSSLGVDPLPTGKYHVKCTDAEVKESGPRSKNPGSQYINFEFTVQSGSYEGRKVWSNATLLPHALFSIKAILEAAGLSTTGELDFELDDIIGKDMTVKVNKLGPTTLPDGKELDERNEVKRFYKFDSENAGQSVGSDGKGSSLLP